MLGSRIVFVTPEMEHLITTEAIVRETDLTTADIVAAEQERLSAKNSTLGNTIETSLKNQVASKKRNQDRMKTQVPINRTPDRILSKVNSKINNVNRKEVLVKNENKAATHLTPLENNTVKEEAKT